MANNPKVVILGAGMSAIACAKNLPASFDVELYEKSRGVGGRLCARRHQKTRFHFGAQFCTATTPSFKNFLELSHAQNFHGPLFNVGEDKVEDTKNYYVHPDGMHALLLPYRDALNIQFEMRACEVNVSDQTVVFYNDLTVPYDILISSLPLPQSETLIEFPAAPKNSFLPCIAVGLMMAESNVNKYNAFKNVSEDISWMGSSKFFNPALEETWVIQFSPKGSQRLASEPDQKIIELAHRSLESVTNDKMNVKDSSIFRWKYAQCGRSTQDQMFTKIKHNIFAIGDWHISSRVESAFLSGKALAEFLSNKRP
ncbi:MAG: hypothetical protein ABS18_05760 [SAR86 cluster bacterium BACL1 MAG-121001-bin56]|nr:MAG: hypothetical protein ABS18_05760 [SAR86 cluster bacterium BACL1 MAG-121001-bin56]